MIPVAYNERVPNGHDKNFVRLCAAVEGFKALHCRWPTRVRMPAGCFEDLRDRVFSPEEFGKLLAKVALVQDETGMVAEDDTGARFAYGRDPRPEHSGEMRPQEWLGVTPRSS